MQIYLHGLNVSLYDSSSAFSLHLNKDHPSFFYNRHFHIMVLSVDIESIWVTNLWCRCRHWKSCIYLLGSCAYIYIYKSPCVYMYSSSFSTVTLGPCYYLDLYNLAELNSERVPFIPPLSNTSDRTICVSPATYHHSYDHMLRILILMS